MFRPWLEIGDDVPSLIENVDQPLILPKIHGSNFKTRQVRPQFSYSQESDYASRGISLTHAYDFNQKNTTIVLGIAHNFDSVGGGVLTTFQEKGLSPACLPPQG